MIVVGAGPAGSATATLLAAAGLEVLLVDKRRFPRDKTCGDALSSGAVAILRQLGLQRELVSQGHPIERIVVTTPSGVVIDAALPEPAGSPNQARVWPRYELDERLRRRALEAGARFEGGLTVRRVENAPPVIEIIGARRDREIRYAGRCLVLAVGANLRLLQMLGFMRPGRRYGIAARAYYRGVTGIEGRMHFRFDGVSLPGYGWVFPLGGGRANVGAGYFIPRRSRARLKAPGTNGGDSRRVSSSAAGALEAFLHHPPVRNLMSLAKREGPVQGFPLRTDFHRSPVGRGRILLVGEAAGLVNPFTGEGIDYALESALLASQCLTRWHSAPADGEPLPEYERRLRKRFQRYFQLSTLMRSFYMKPMLLDALGRAGNRWPDLTRLLVDILLARQDPIKAFSPRFILRVLRSIPAAPASAFPAKQAS